MQLLQSSDFSWHKDQPDVPEMSADEMKAFLDAPVIKLMQKINEIIGDAIQTNDKIGTMEQTLTSQDKELEFHTYLFNQYQQSKLDSPNGISGTEHVNSLRAISYATDEVTLLYPVNAETFEVGSLMLAPGSMILKMPFEVNGMDCGYFYIFPSYKEGEDDLGANREILYERLIPTYDELYGGMIYSLQSVGGYTAGEGIRIENGIISLAIENAEGGSY